jgi:N-acetylglucosaminyldiphosphoundecaprenol N-acetyl-beta-D-mannosaminyltransferase
MSASANQSRSLPRSLIGLAASCETTDLEAAAAEVIERAASRAGGYVCLCNVHVVTSALHDRSLREALAGAWCRLPDGAPVAWLLRWVSGERAERIGGPDLMPLVFARGRDRGLRHFLLGSTPEVLARLSHRLSRDYPGSVIVGTDSPPFELGEVRADLDSIRAADPHVVWCALGAPKQELWMHRHAGELDGALVVGVGAAFDFLGGTKRRAPRWMRRLGLEWLHRLLTEPRRLLGRYARTNSEFVARGVIELVRRRFAA